MDKARTKEILVSVGFPFVLGIACVTFALWLLPKNCSLFVSNLPGPQMCHTIPVDDCSSFCQDGRGEWFASLVAVFGVCVFFVPFIVYLLKDLLNRSVERTKLFD
ncbi:MAG TPA: hypothetical protein VK400_02510 [Pyrinomonadaceae bacterium]|nr:hypothetical protein [Pyrinomonadaceae bacterium]